MGLNFTPVVNAAANTLVTSASATVSGLTLGTKVIQIVSPSGQLSVNGRAWATNDVVQNGDTVRLRVTTPNSELGEVTTVTVDVQSLGYIDWDVTNANNMVSEVGSGSDTVGWFSVTPGTPIDEEATGFDYITGENFTVIDEQGIGTDDADYSVTTGAMVFETGFGDGVGFPSADELLDEVAEGVDTLFGSLIIQVDEIGAASDALLPSVTTSAMVSEVGSGVGSIITASSSEVVDEDGFGADFLFGSALVTEDVWEVSGASLDELFPMAYPGALVDEVGGGVEELMPINNVTVNYDNVGFGFDEVLLSYPTHGAWAFNSRTMAISRWDALRVLEVHEVGGVVYGLAADGLYVMGTTAADARAESGLYDFGVIEKKKLRHIYLTYTAQSPLYIGVVHTNGGAKSEVVYGKPAYQADSPIQTRVDLGRGPDARYWGVAITNTDNRFASVKDMRLVPNVTSRRI